MSGTVPGIDQLGVNSRGLRACQGMKSRKRPYTN